MNQDYLKQIYEYKDGNLHLRSTGSRVGYINGSGRVVVCHRGKYYYLHRLVWLYHKGYLPEPPIVIDHRDRNLLNNRIENLREADPHQSSCNRVEDNSTGFKGVVKHNNRWKAKIKCKGQHIHIGYFDTPEEASKAYNERAKELFGEFAT